MDTSPLGNIRTRQRAPPDTHAVYRWLLLGRNCIGNVSTCELVSASGSLSIRRSTLPRRCTTTPRLRAWRMNDPDAQYVVSVLRLVQPVSSYRTWPADPVHPIHLPVD